MSDHNKAENQGTVSNSELIETLGALTDEQCRDFRRMACSFNDMVRAIYQSGFDKAKRQALGIMIDCDDIKCPQNEMISCVECSRHRVAAMKPDLSSGP